MDLLQVIGWHDCFETHRTRGTTRQTQCLVPNKQGGGGYTTLLAMKNGEALYGAFHAMILYLSKQESRNGWITKDGTDKGDPLTSEDLADAIQFSAATTQKMLSVITNEIGWIVNHSTEKRSESAAYPDKRVGTEFIAMAQTFHRIQITNHPHEPTLQEGKRVLATLKGARLLEKFHLENNWEIKRIERLLTWIPGNNFWGHSIRSLASIRNISRSNDAYKFNNALSEMEAEVASSLISGEKLDAHMHQRGLTQNDYDQIIDDETGVTMWRLKA